MWIWLKKKTTATKNQQQLKQKSPGLSPKLLKPQGPRRYMLIYVFNKYVNFGGYHWGLQLQRALVQYLCPLQNFSDPVIQELCTGTSHLLDIGEISELLSEGDGDGWTFSRCWGSGHLSSNLRCPITSSLCNSRRCKGCHWGLCPRIILKINKANFVSYLPYYKHSMGFTFIIFLDVPPC